MSNPIRRAFFDRTNVNNAGEQTQIPVRRKQDEKSHVPNKRRKLADPIPTPNPHISGISSNTTKFRKLQLKQKYGHSVRSVLTPLSSRSILTTFVSSQKTDRYCLHLRDDTGIPSIAFSCAFSRGAKKGRSAFLSVGTHDGAVEILNTKTRLDWDTEPQRSVLKIHDSAIFGLQYGFDDEYIATASHDSSCRITSLSTQQCTAVLTGHTGPVKTVDWLPNHNSLLCTGGRDGSICLWDIRSSSRTNGESNISPACILYDAHSENAFGGRKKKPASIKSVTSVICIPGTSQVISSSSFDAKLRHWDFRYVKDGIATDIGASLDDPTLTTGKRSRGISSLALGSNLSAGYIWSVAADSRVHRYAVPLGTPSSYQPKALEHPNLKVRSFYVKLAMSPCGRWLASGSSNGGTYIWDVNDPLSSAPVELISSTKEVGSLDWANDMLATCCDDGIVRIWRPNAEVAYQCKANAEEERWNWFWSKDL